MMKKWSDKEILLALKLHLLGKSIAEIALELERTYDSVQKKLNKLLAKRDAWMFMQELIDEYKKKYSDEEIADMLGISVEDLNNMRLVSYRQEVVNGKDLWELMIGVQEALLKKRNIVDEIAIRIDGGNAIGIVFMGDMHIGGIHCDYKKLKEDIEFISQLDNVYVVLMGDLIDNYIFKFGKQDELFSSRMQLMLLRDIFDKIGDKVIGIITGDHESFTNTASMLDMYSDILNRFSLGWGGVLTINFGEQRYRIALRHRYRFNSSDNLTHTVKKMLEKIYDADIGVVGHQHEPAIEMFTLRGRKRLAIRTGTYKLGDEYTERMGYVGSYSVPSVILFSNKYDFMPVEDLKRLKELLSIFNGGE